MTQKYLLREETLPLAQIPLPYSRTHLIKGCKITKNQLINMTFFQRNINIVDKSGII